MRIMMRSNKDREWKPVDSASYENEAELQELLAESPSLIPLDELGEGASGLRVAVREFGLPGSGSTDIVAFNPDGEIAVVECKLAANPEAKRKVIGQILEYGAFLWQTSFDEVNERVRSRRGSDLTVLMKEATAGEDWDEEAFRQTVSACLSTGRFFLVVAVDSINDELARTINYVNQGGQLQFSLHALEMRLLRQGNVEVLVPHVHGIQERHPSETGRRRWDEESFFEDARGSLSSEELAVVRDLCNWTKSRADEISWGAGKVHGSFTFRCYAGSTPFSVLSVYSHAYACLSFAYINDASEEVAAAFYEAIKGIRGFAGWPGRTELKYPYFYIKDVFLGDPEGLKAFKAAVEAFQEGVRKSGTQS